MSGLQLLLSIDRALGEGISVLGSQEQLLIQSKRYPTRFTHSVRKIDIILLNQPIQFISQDFNHSPFVLRSCNNVCMLQARFVSSIHMDFAESTSSAQDRSVENLMVVCTLKLLTCMVRVVFMNLWNSNADSCTI